VDRAGGGLRGPRDRAGGRERDGSEVCILNIMVPTHSVISGYMGHKHIVCC